MSTLTDLPHSPHALELQASLSKIKKLISVASEDSAYTPILVAVSKYKPVSDITAVYDAGQRDFGENYVQELLEKAPMLPSDIRWHFIGHLQSNKAKSLAAIQNLHTLHTLTSTKLATTLNKFRDSASPLNVLLQVNTSGEDAKSGLQPLRAAEDVAISMTSTPSDDTLVAVARHVISSCPNLRLAGLMTIGSLESSLNSGEKNHDFHTLISTRNILEDVLRREFPPAEDSGKRPKWGSEEGGGLILSMGMTNDFEAALRAGSRIVRVGTGIFGQRPPK